jgi:cytochrome c553
MVRRMVRVAIAVLALGIGGATAAEKAKSASPPPAAPTASAAPEPPAEKPYAYDPDMAKDIMRICAGCHGEFGAGGNGYPRLAGLNAEYLAEQIRMFKSRERENIPMIPFTTERELPEREVLDISRYLSEITLSTKPPPEDDKIDGFARLMLMKQVVQIPREPGDAEAGREFYTSECGPCHGRQGEGRIRKPPLAGQYIPYLKTQIAAFLAGKRKHDDVDQIMRPRQPAEWQNLWAYVSMLGR